MSISRLRTKTGSANWNTGAGRWLALCLRHLGRNDGQGMDATALLTAPFGRRRRAAPLQGSFGRGRRVEGHQLVDAVARGVGVGDAGAALHCGAGATLRAVGGELRFNVAHRVDAIAAGVVEVVRLAKTGAAEVPRRGVADDAV